MLTEGLIYFAIVFGPWAFGTTQAWSIQVMNGVGLTLGLLWLVKQGLRASGASGIRWTDPRHQSSSSSFSSSSSLRVAVTRRVPLTPSLSPSGGEGARRAGEGAGWLVAERRFTVWLAAGTICILLYCLVSAWNARAIYQPAEWNFEYLPAIPWLPHSYDRDSSWAAFWKYLALAGLFWALRDWLMGERDHGPQTTDHGLRKEDRGQRSEVGGQRSVVSSSSRSDRLPVRLRRLFWLLTLNGTALAFQGLMQRAEGGNQLLWLVEPHIGKTDFHFGPYAYRSNAAQYFNLLWPAVLGFWWANVRSLRSHSRMAVLLPCVVVMAVCPFVSASRGGAIVLVGNLIMAGGILLLAQWRKHWFTKISLLLGLAGVLGIGALLGWQTLAPRMELLREGYAGREFLYQAGRNMAQDNAWFGTGPGTFSTLYPLYRRFEIGNLDDRVAQMHNDWLETRITFGWLGTIPILFTLLLVLAHWFRGGGIYGNKYFVMLLWVALGGCLVHAAFDFPLQVHSVLTLFLVLCAVLSCLSRRGTGTGE